MLVERLGLNGPDVLSFDIPLANEPQQRKLQNTPERVIELDGTLGWKI